MAGVVVSVVSTATLVASGPRLSTVARFVLVAGAVGGYGLLLVTLARGADLRQGPIIAAIVALLGVAVVMPPRESGDLFTYAVYGRMVTVHHVNPYRTAPNEFPHDPLLPRVGVGHRDERFLYGPAFLGVTVAAAPIVGTSALRARLVYQGMAALAVSLALLLVWRRTRDTASLAWLGLHPVIALQVVNGGHNDALVGLAVVAAVLLAERSRWKLAGFAVALGALIKVWAVVAAFGLAVFVWRRRDRVAAAALALTTSTVGAAGYLIVGGLRALQPLEAARNRISSASAWRLPVVVGLGRPGPVWIGVGTGLVVTVCIASPRVRNAAGAAFVGLGAYLLAAPYVLAWYPGAVLPAAALERRRVSATILSAHAAMLVVAYQVLLHAPSSSAGHEAMRITRVVAPTISAAMVVSYVVATRTALRRGGALPFSATGRGGGG
jgi:hypothetical protein